MGWLSLYDYQREAIKKMHNGCILCGGVGSGKSRTALAYFYLQHGGDVDSDTYTPMDDVDLPNLIIITTAKKRDSGEWEEELVPFLLYSRENVRLYNHYVVVDSWNNISKWTGQKGAFFIFDEQRVVGNGEWVNSFLKITKKNEWIMLSATPGDTWSDYIPVFIANGFYGSRTEFNSQHVIFSRWTKYPKVDRYINIGRLMRLRDRILVEMEFERQTISHHEYVECDYDRATYRAIMSTRWNTYTNEPIKNAAELCRILRKLVNLDPSRFETLIQLMELHPKCIIFYNYDYELDALMEVCAAGGIEFTQWNGHKHQEIPDGDRWAYLVQYNAGAEGWNCIKTDTIIFFSQNYSYKIMTQSAGRIDRMNTPYKHLWYYHLWCKAPIEIAIRSALQKKKNFNESRYFNRRIK